MKLTELEPQLVRYETKDHEFLVHVASLSEAQGVQFLCPSCFMKNGGATGTHLIEVSFAEKGVRDNQGSHNREGKPSRWSVRGGDISSITLQPSILIDADKPACEGWHGHITNGEIC